MSRERTRTRDNEFVSEAIEHHRLDTGRPRHSSNRAVTEAETEPWGKAALS